MPASMASSSCPVSRSENPRLFHAAASWVRSRAYRGPTAHRLTVIKSS